MRLSQFIQVWKTCIAMMVFSLLFSHYPGKGRVFKKHIFILFLPDNGFPVSIFGMLFKNLITICKKVIEANIIVSNVPGNDSSWFGNPKEFLECLRNNGTWEHTSRTQQCVIS